MKTPDQIAAAADNLTGRANTAAINAAFRKQDESHLWPISGRFNATERAIKATRKAFVAMGSPCEGLEYALALYAEISRIVNSED